MNNKILKFILAGIFISMVVSGCMKKITIEDETAARLCKLANSKLDQQTLAVEIAGLLKVDTSKVRISKEGIYVVMRAYYVIEDGIFISLSEKEMPMSGDPSYIRLHGCVYRYHISG